MGKEAATADTRLTVLADHYKDTQRIIEQAGRARDRNFLYIFVLLGVMAFQFFSPQTSGDVFGEVISKQLGITTPVGIGYIGSLIWFGLMAVAVRYFQVVINLEKQYNYIHALEEELSREYGGKAFTREGAAYLKNYPVFSSWLHVVYRAVFPALLILAATVKITGEWRLKHLALAPLALDTVIWLMLVVSTCLYVYSLQGTKKDSYK